MILWSITPLLIVVMWFFFLELMNVNSFLEDIKGTMGTFYELSIMENSNVSLSGIENINGKDAYKIDMSGTSMLGSTYYDVATGLKVKETSVINMGGQTQSSEILYSDYKEIDGIMFANKKSTSFGPQVVEMTLKEALINSGISEADFEYDLTLII